MVLQKLAAEEGSMIRYLDRTDCADWLLRWNRSEVYLVPASGMATSGKANALPPSVRAGPWRRATRRLAAGPAARYCQGP